MTELTTQQKKEAALAKARAARQANKEKEAGDKQQTTHDMEALKAEARKRREANKRANKDGFVKRLPDVIIPGCVTYWAKDTMGNIERLKNEGYFIVPNQKPIGIRETAEEEPTRQIKHILMAIPDDLHKERRTEKNAAIKETEKDIVAGTYKNDNLKDGSSYAPKGGLQTSIKHSS